MNEPLSVYEAATPYFDRDWLRPRFWPIWVGFAILWLLSLLPVQVRHALARVVGRAGYRWNPKRRTIVLANLAMAFPDMDIGRRQALARQHFYAMSRSFLDTGLLWFGSDRKLTKAVRVEGAEFFEAARLEGKPVIYHVAHSAALEFGAIGVGLLAPSQGMYQPFKNPLLEWQVAKARHRFGNRVSRRVLGFREIVRAVRSGRPLYMFTDEDFGLERSEVVPFFAHDKATITTTPRLASATGAAVIPVMTVFDESSGQYVTRLGNPLQQLGGTKESATADALLLNEALEQLISRDVSEYMWTLKIYRSTAPASVYAEPLG